MRTKCQLRNAIPPARSGAGMLLGELLSTARARGGWPRRRMRVGAHDARAASKNTRVASSPVRSSASDNVIPSPAMRSLLTSGAAGSWGQFFQVRLENDTPQKIKLTTLITELTTQFGRPDHITHGRHILKWSQTAAIGAQLTIKVTSRFS